MIYARRLARENLVKATNKIAARINRHRCPRIYEVGDEVYKLQMVKPDGLSKFCWSPYVGPYVVTAVHKPNVYNIQMGNIKDTVHADRLKPYCGLQSEPVFDTTPEADDANTDQQPTIDLLQNSGQEQTSIDMLENSGHDQTNMLENSTHSPITPQQQSPLTTEEETAVRTKRKYTKRVYSPRKMKVHPRQAKNKRH